MVWVKETKGKIDTSSRRDVELGAEKLKEFCLVGCFINVLQKTLAYHSYDIEVYRVSIVQTNFVLSSDILPGNYRYL